MSNFTNGSTTTLVHRHDGHKEGYLNCLAVRHGWTRTFSISPDELSALDYTQLEKVLELGTLKLRPYMVRIFVEEPVGSGTFAKVRYWKDDGSLQSVLVKEFFAKRCANGGITTFELRDGRDRREDGEDGRDNDSTFGSKTSLALAKLRRKGSLRSTASVPQPTPAPTVATGTTRFFDFFRLPRSIKPKPPPSVSKPIPMVDDVDDDDETEPDLPTRTADPEEQALLQRRGWMPPILNRVLGGGGDTPAPVPTPAASSSSAARRSSGKGKGRADPLDATPGPGEEDAHPLGAPMSDEEWEVQDALPMDALAQNGKHRPGIFARLNSKDRIREESGTKESKKKSKSSKKKKEKEAAPFQGAQRVSRPEDAMPPPSPKEAGPSATTNPFDD